MIEFTLVLCIPACFFKFISERQRNEFLHKLLLKLDPRQHYYVSSLLSVSSHSKQTYMNGMHAFIVTGVQLLLGQVKLCCILA